MNFFIQTTNEQLKICCIDHPAVLIGLNFINLTFDLNHDKKCIRGTNMRVTQAHQLFGAIEKEACTLLNRKSDNDRDARAK